jgi:hypothetical protein
MERTGVFLPGVPSSELIFGHTTTCPHDAVCAPFSFALTGLLVLIIHPTIIRLGGNFSNMLLRAFALLDLQLNLI